LTCSGIDGGRFRHNARHVQQRGASAPFLWGEPPISAETHLSRSRLYVAAAAVSLGTFLTVIDGAIATVALPTIAQDLHVDGSAAVLVVTVYQLMMVTLLLPFSALGDRIGIKRFYQGGQVVFTLATALCFFAKSLPFLLVVRALQAIGAAACQSVMSAMIRAIYPSNRLGRGLGLNGVVVSIAGALAPTAGGLILSVSSWPYVFAVGAPFGVLSLLLGRVALPDLPAHEGEYNLLGAVLCFVSFGLLIAGLEALVHGNSPVVSMAIVLIGVGLGVILVLHELRERIPILPVDLLSNGLMRLSLGGGFVAFIGAACLSLSLPFHLAHGYGWAPGEIGAVLSPWPAAMMVMMPLAGALSDRYPAGLLGGIGMTIATVAMLLMAFLPEHPTYYDIAWRMFLSGLGYGLFLAPNSRIVIGASPRHRAAAAGGLLATGRLCGQTIGATLVAALLALGLGTTRAPALIAACLTAVACGCSLARLRPVHADAPNTPSDTHIDIL